MSRPLVVLPQAIDDIEGAAKWYNRRTVGLGKLFLHDLDRQLRRIGEFPELYPMVNDTCRRSHLQRFPYTVVYRVRSNVIEIIAVFHHRSDPDILEVRSDTH